MATTTPGHPTADAVTRGLALLNQFTDDELWALGKALMSLAVGRPPVTDHTAQTTRAAFQLLPGGAR